MIKSFKSKETEKIWKGKASKALPLDIQHGARRKLRILNNANDLNDIRIPPANHLEALKGNRKGQHSVRINDQWRICFRWFMGDCFNVEIVDYH
ncbi:MAG: type II toxin-antitoxin system RelE/ParE family toxin [Proteobacteria bacterium]|jgi:proteic killer suppression protein|nr:type II toxin-antitoxin system RelE/ParE family toxin [Pseudomonadota bacterium]